MPDPASTPAAYAAQAPSRAELDVRHGLLLLEFGADWCAHCQAAQPAIAEALKAYPSLPHLKVEDGPGRPLGRSFAVKLWPTLVLLQDGRPVGRLVRPRVEAEVLELLQRLA